MWLCDRLVFALCMGVISISLFACLRRFIPFYVLRQVSWWNSLIAILIRPSHKLAFPLFTCFCHD